MKIKLFGSKLQRYLLLLFVLGIGLGWLIYRHYFAQQVLTVGVYTGSSWDVPSGQGSQIIDDVIKRFEKEHPNVKVVYESGISKEDYSNWLSDKIVEGDQPDVFMVPENDFNLLASTNALASLNSKMKRDLDTTIFYSSSLKAGEYRNDQYALPFENNPVMMCINSELLKQENIAIPESGWTLEEFYEICKKVTKDTDGDGIIDQYGSVGYTWQNAVAANGLSLFNEAGDEVNLNNEKMREILNWVSQLNTLNGNYTVSSTDFDKGNVAFMPMTLAEYRTYKPYPYHVSKYSSFTWTCVQMPSAADVTATTQTSTSLLAMSAKTNQTELAWEFLELLCADQETQQEVFAKSQGASVLKSVMKSADTKEILQGDSFGSTALTVDTLNQMLETSIPEPKFKQYNDLLEKADYLITQSLSKGTIDTDLAQIQQEIEDTID
ncbi:ABC transporter substrate-binding protein [Streptococcus dentiloxodontae]